MMYRMQISKQAQAQLNTHDAAAAAVAEIRKSAKAQAQAQAQAHAQARVRRNSKAQAQALGKNVMAARRGMPNGQMSPGQMRDRSRESAGTDGTDVPRTRCPKGQMPQGQMPPGQMPPGQMRPQHPMPQQGPMARMLQPEGFMKNLVAFMNSKNLPSRDQPGRRRPAHQSLSPLPASLQISGIPQCHTVQPLASSGCLAAMGASTISLAGPPQLKAVYRRNLIQVRRCSRCASNTRNSRQACRDPPTMPPGTARPSPCSRPGSNIPAHMMGPGAQQQLQQAPMPSPIKPQDSIPGAIDGFPAPPSCPRSATTPAPRGTPEQPVEECRAPSDRTFPCLLRPRAKLGSLSLPGSAHPESQAAQGKTAATMRFPRPCLEPRGVHALLP